MLLELLQLLQVKRLLNRKPPMLSSFLGRVLVSSGQMPYVEVDIDGLYTKAEILSFVYAYCSNVGFTLIDDGLYRDWETDRKSTRLNSSHRL